MEQCGGNSQDLVAFENRPLRRFFFGDRERRKMVCSKFIFCGVKEGFHNDTEYTPSMAAEIVSALLKKRGLEVCVYGGLAVYPYDRGCPRGGEPVAALKLEGEANNILAIGEFLREELKQATLNIPLIGYGVPTLGFVVQTSGNICDLGRKWQETAKKYMLTDGIHVSVGLVDVGENLITLSADANPYHILDLNKWQNIALKICEELNLEEPVFQNVGYNFLPEIGG